MKRQSPPPRPPTQVQQRVSALQEAITRCKTLMRSAKKHSDMSEYASYAKQTYVLKQQLRNARRQLAEQSPTPEQ